MEKLPINPAQSAGEYEYYNPTPSIPPKISDQVAVYAPYTAIQKFILSNVIRLLVVQCGVRTLRKL